MGIAAALAKRLHVDAPFARLAQAIYTETLRAGCGDDDDAVLIGRAIEAATPPNDW